MIETRTVLFELGTEELPPHSLETLKESLADGVVAELEDVNLSFDPAVVAYASSRRLALRIPKVAARTDERAEIRKGPSVAAAFGPEGEPTRALLGFAEGCQADLKQVQRWKDGKDLLKSKKGEWIRFEQVTEPRRCQDVLPDIFDRVLAGLPLTKRMRWGARETSFLRPARWVVLLYGSEPVEGEVMDLACGVVTRGHRFLGEKYLELTDADAYEATLRTRGRVLVAARARREEASRQITDFEAGAGVSVVRPDALFEEVCASAEHPVAVAGRFDEEFLDLPEEVVRAVLEDQQKYFATRTPDGMLSRHFLSIANLPDVNGDIGAGCERVVRSRLQDAAFYLERDQSRSFESRVEDLGRVVFHRKLGTLLERVQRIEGLASHVARKVDADVAVVARAARLCKADLGTDIVQSFPKLQGVMGARYARTEGESDAVCQAISDHYRPRHADDELPETLPGQALALADRLDMLTGVFSVGEAPTGTRDPFGVRRAAYGILRLTVERGLDLDLEDCLAQAAEGYPSLLQASESPRAVLDYLADRMRGYGLERGQSRDAIEAVLAVGFMRPLDAFRRVRAIEGFRGRPQAQVLVATHKRIRNILREAEASDESVDPKLLVEPTERALASQLGITRAEVLRHCAARHYEEALDALAGVAEPVSAFFDAVLVMAEEGKIRHNRLRLLWELQELFLRIADFSHLQEGTIS